MATYNYDDTVSFDLPYDYELQSEINDEGDEVFTIRGEFYLDDDLERQSKYFCRISEGTMDWDEEVAGKTMLQLWQEGFSDKENIKYASLQEKPSLMFMTMGQGMLIFGRELRMMVTTAFVEVSPDKFLVLIGTNSYNEDDPENDKNAQAAIEKMRMIVESISINGKKVYSGIPDSWSLYTALKPCFDGGEPIDTGIKLNITINAGDTSTTYEYGSSGDEPKVTTFQLNHATPEERLYPHYHSLKFGPTAMLSMLGAQINTTGTEYSFMPLSREMEDPEDELSESGIAVLQRIVAADAGKYNLHKSAAQMAPLFRVDSSVFDAKHDRESELMDGLMHRSYMMSALRSFAWSLSDWCVQKSVKPADLTYDELCRIIAFVSGENWLNYDETYCNGLCGCPDLHVYYLPDSVSHSDRQALLPSAEKLAEIEAIKEKFPNFNQILSTVHSLDSLRRDLEYVFPAIETIYAQLEAERDRTQPLTGDVADILYAWCALALAAKEPFFSEDGPMNCWFDQKDEPIVPYVITKGNKVTLEQKTDDFVTKSSAKEAVQTTLDLPNGIYTVDGNYAVIDDDWAIRLPDGWVYSTDPEITGGRSFVANSGEDYENNDGIAIYSDNCFTVFQKSDNGLISMMAGSLLNQNADALISRSDLQVTYNCNHSDDTTYCQYVIVTTKWATYMIQFFYTDPNLNEYGRIREIEKILKTICLADEVPDSMHTLGKTSISTVGKTAQTSSRKSENPAARASTNKPVSIETPAITCTKVKQSECTIDENGVFCGYHGSETNIALPNEVREIGSSCEIADTVRSITIPNSVTSIGECAFYECTNLKSITIPNSVTSIGAYAFSGCTGLTSITIPNSVTSIGAYAFEGCAGLTSITIPNSVTSIDEYTFYECTSLTSITLPDGLIAIGDSAFAECYGLAEIIIPDSVKFIGEDAFSDCNCGDGDICIRGAAGGYAEKYCREYGISFFEYIPVVGKSTQIASQKSATPVARASSNKPVSTETPAITCTKVKKSDCSIDVLGVLESYNGLDDEIILPSGIEEIGSDAFSFNKTLRIVVIPEGVRVIGNDAFWGCEALEQVFLPSTLEKIEYNAFRNCESLTEIIIPDGVWSIGMDAFTGCKKLKDIYVPSSAISVEMDAFYTFNDDTVIHTPQWSSAETYAEEHDMRVDHRQAPVRTVPKAKRNTSQTKAAAAKAAATTGNSEDFEISKGVLKKYNGHEEHLLIPEGVHTIASKAFEFNYELKTVMIPEGVHTIEESAFCYCSFLENITLPSTLKTLSGLYHLNLKKLYIPVGVEVVGKSAFYGCSELRQVILPPTVTRIEDWAFAACSKKKEIYIPESVTYIGDFAFNHSPRTILHVHPGSYAEEFAKGYKVKFDNEVESYLEELEKAKKGPAKKKSTSKAAKAVTEAIVETTPAEPAAPFSLSASGKTLNKYEGKESIVVVPDGVTEIDSFAFSKQKVTVVTLPDSVKKIGEYAFTDCSKLVQINIPASVTSVGESAFNQCSSLTEIVWPGNVKTIPANACWHCDALAKVVIEEGITEIGGSAFSFCPKLKDLHLPQSINKIGDHALLMSGSPTLHVYLDSYAEKYAKENNLPTVILLTPEQEAEKKRQEEARRIAEEKYAAELKAWEQNCGEIRTLREQRVSELLEEKRVALKNEAQSAYDAAVAVANKRKEAAQQKKSDAEMRLSALGIFKLAEKKAAKAAIQEAETEIQSAEAALVIAKQSLDKDLAAIPTAINAHRSVIARQVEQVYPLPAKPSK